MSYKPYFKDANGNLVDLSLHAELADKLGTKTIGSTSEPIFLNGGVPEKCSGLRAMIVDLIYPVGSIYISVNSANPQTLFGGTWEQLKDRFLLGAGSSYSLGATGGETTHKLTVDEMPSHTHTQNSHNHTQDSHTHLISTSGCHGMNGNGSRQRYSDGDSQSNGNAMYTGSSQPSISGTVATNNNTGGDKAHNNMPPYLAVNIWKRTA